ncbi:MAG: FtsW/RodA/SpoVE family cell cycle protein [Clostridiales bacterium]|nr:FtsW/RodA/SpoVE family cell cycle protein [Candidatus Cacconaster stercorequi]
MNELIYNFTDNLLSSLLWCGRIVAVIFAIILLVRCCRSFFGGKAEQESWGFLSLSNGARYELNHWENVIGRARSADIRVNFPSVSRNHACLCRDDAAHWRIYPVSASGSVLVNKEAITEPTILKPGDAITVGGADLYFFPGNADDEARQAEKRTKPGKAVSPTVNLLLLTIFQVLMLLQFVPCIKQDTAMPIFVSFTGLCAAEWGLYGLYRLLHRTAFELETLSFLLITVGFSIAAAYSPGDLYKQLVAMLLGIIVFLILSFVLRNLRIAIKLRWPVAAAAAALLAFNVLFGQQIFGARNWVSIGPISFQPSEFVKLAFILVGATTLDRLFAKRNIIFTMLFSAYCVGCLALMSDFGTALIFFVAFLCIAFLRTGDLPSIIMMVAAAACGGYVILRFKPYIADRFTVWRHAWEFTQSSGYQQCRTMSAISSGGLFGTGPESAWLKYVGAANTDLVFGVVGEEFGLLLSICCIAVLIILAVFTLESAATARSTFYTIVSCAAVVILIFQTTLNVLGAVDILPLTGVTFPFVSMGGSSMIACWGLMAFLKSADTRQNASFTLRLPKKARSPYQPPAPPAEKKQESFFDSMPEIPVDDIFGKETRK